MRHKSLAYTQIYLSRLIFYEDIKREMQRLQALPQERDTSVPFHPRTARIYSKMSNSSTMKFAGLRLRDVL